MSFFKSKESRFQLISSFKIVIVPIFATLFCTYMIWVLTSMSYLFFEANGFTSSSELREAFFDKSLSVIIDNLTYFLLYFIILFFIGIYIASLLLRPFNQIGKYSEDAMVDNFTEYKADLLSDLKLLTNFSQIFFDYLDQCKVNKKFEVKAIQDKFSNIHNPVFDKNFFFSYTLLIMIITVVSSLSIYYITLEIHSSIVDLAVSFLKTDNKNFQLFFTKQDNILNSVHFISSAVIILLYYSLIKSIIDTVSGVEYNYFNTMRSFMSGDTNARVQLRKNDPGHANAEKLNAYLDHLQKNLEKTE